MSRATLSRKRRVDLHTPGAISIICCFEHPYQGNAGSFGRPRKQKPDYIFGSCNTVKETSIRLAGRWSYFEIVFLFQSPLSRKVLASSQTPQANSLYIYAHLCACYAHVHVWTHDTFSIGLGTWKPTPSVQPKRGATSLYNSQKRNDRQHNKGFQCLPHNTSEEVGSPEGCASKRINRKSS